PIQREKLFEEISWSGANVIFPVPKVETALQQEIRGLLRSAIESAVAVNQVGKIFKVWEVSLVSVGDAQTQRESRLKGVYTGAQTEDILSQSQKERFNRRKSGKSVIMQNQNKGKGEFKRFSSGIFRRKQDGQRVIDFKGKGKFGRGNRM
ncbi:MAG: hypothetical protein EZS28_021424, partial [Streblomastix strix]